MQEETIRFRNGDLGLDGRLAAPAGATRGCVVCHPHPMYGGDMRNAVVVATCRALAAAGVAALRFDFRGVGASDGQHDGGNGEVSDALAAAAALAARGDLAGVTVAGYSFGAAVALRAAASASPEDPGPRVAAAAAIAPPLAMFDASFAAALPMPLLLVAGEADQFCPRDAFDSLVAACGGTGRVDSRVLAGTDHFLGGREDEVGRLVAEWIGRA